MKKFTKNILIFTFLIASQLSSPTQAKVNSVESVQKTTEMQIRNLIEPLLDKYCHEQCRLMSVNSTVDVADQDQIAPGFDEIEASRSDKLAPSFARIKVLMDDKVGPLSRNKLTDLLQQFLDTLDYPVKIETQLAHFPTALASVGKATELRDKVGKQFKNTIDELFSKFCPNHCLMADYALESDVVNGEEAQYGNSGEFVQDGDVAIKIKDISATLLIDEAMPAEERANILEMAKLKTNFLKNVTLTGKSLRFPHPMSEIGPNGELLYSNGASYGANGMLRSKDEKSVSNKTASDTSTNESKFNNKSSNELKSQSNASNTNDSKSNTSENNVKQERFEHFEKIERVENGDAVQQELGKFKVYGLVFACSVLSLLIFLAAAGFRNRKPVIDQVMHSIQPMPMPAQQTTSSEDSTSNDRGARVSKRYEIERLMEELTTIFVQQPRVVKHVFSRVLTEEGIEICSAYIQLFGETIVMDMLRDPSLQSDISELVEFYAKNPMELEDDEKLDLLRKLHNRTVAGKLVVMGNRSSNLFDYLAEMDGTQVMELIRNESLTVKSIVLTQCDPQKRGVIYSQVDEATRMKLLNELSRIDYLPRDYIYNVAQALKRKRRENPKLNTEALPGSEVLINLLERTGLEVQRTVMNSLEASNPESARNVRSKLVSLDTLQFLRDNQLLEVILSLKHDELLIFLKGSPSEVKSVIFAKSPKELSSELDEELAAFAVPNRESYQSIERKVLNRMKVMSNEGLINLLETNERMFQATPPGEPGTSEITSLPPIPGATIVPIKKVAGW